VLTIIISRVFRLFPFNLFFSLTLGIGDFANCSRTFNQRNRFNISTSFRKDFPVLIEMTLLSASVVVLKKFLSKTKFYANFKMHTQWKFGK